MTHKKEEECESIINCTLCTMTFINQTNLNKHVTENHNLTQQKPTDLSKKRKKTQPTLSCNQCNAGFSDFESFRRHLKVFNH
jgi:uncharacterized C2H2 Zn-finger protein